MLRFMIRDPVDRKRPLHTSTPFRQFVVKVHSRCNLSCRYCYLYTMADQRWRQRPPVMPPAVVAATADRIAAHVRAHALAEVSIVLHGGEPLLAGPQRLRDVVVAIRDAVGGTTRVRFAVQTNGTLLNRRFLRLLDEFDVRVGVSLDGEGATHDRNRPGRRVSSYARVVEGLTELDRPEFRHLFSGLLCVIDLEADPLATYEALLAFEPPSVDFLLPHATWSAPPPVSATAYADWLIPIFDRWFHEPERRAGIRIFEEIMNTLLGGASAVETIGTSPAGMIVVETDGHIEQSDVLAATYEGAADLGLDVFHDDFDAALAHPKTRARQSGISGIPTDCLPCTWASVCGGGLYAHRYTAGAGCDHRSVYCEGLARLFSHIHATLSAALAAEGTTDANLVS